MDKEILILTYPRTGQHLLRLLFSKSNAKFNWTHNIDNSKFKWKSDLDRPFYDGSQDLITIVRDPKETIASSIVYTIFQNDNNLPEEIVANLAIFSKSFTNEYVLFWEYVLEHCDVYISYEDLISNPDTVMNYLSKAFNFLYDSSKTETFVYDKKHLISSKSHALYNDIVEQVNKFDLSRCYEVYDRCKTKCIVVE